MNVARIRQFLNWLYACETALKCPRLIFYNQYIIFMGKLACSRLQDSATYVPTIGLEQAMCKYSRYKVQNCVIMYFQIAVQLYLKVLRPVFVLHVIVYLFLVITDKGSA